MAQDHHSTCGGCSRKASKYSATKRQIGATVSVLLTAWIGNLLFGAPTGFVAAVLLAVSLILGVEARMAKIT